MYLANNSIIPQKQFQHDPNIKDSYSKIVREYLEDKHLPIPNEWYDEEYKKNNDYKPEYVNNIIYETVFRIFKAKPEIQYDNRWTVAMIYASQGVIPPKQWEHNTILQNIHGDTVALILARNGIIPQEQWGHDRYLENNYHETVCKLLIDNQIFNIPQMWKYNFGQYGMSYDSQFYIQRDEYENSRYNPNYTYQQPSGKDNYGDPIYE